MQWPTSFQQREVVCECWVVGPVPQGCFRVVWVHWPPELLYDVARATHKLHNASSTLPPAF